ncbi:beta-lactamase superfamily II metal-dependent hydrolase [Pseudomonas sp. TE36184]
MSKQRLYCLDVGQGMCTYFEGYDDDDNVIANALFDLGSTKTRRRAGRPTIQFLKQQIIARSDDDEGYLDAVFLSHKDADHINLIRGLLEELPNMKIGHVFHSGRYKWYAGKKTKNVLGELGKRTEDASTHVLNFAVGTSSFPTGDPQHWHSVWGNETVNAYVIAVNTPMADTKQGVDVDVAYAAYDEPDGNLANSTSLGIYLQMFNVGAVIFGDATFSTFQFVNRHFLEHKVWLSNSFMLQAPHHGSRSTTFGLKVSNALISKEAAQVVRTFASLTYGATIIVSADTSHDHPSLDTINAFLPFADHRGPWWADEHVQPNHLVSTYFDVPLSNTQGALNTNYTYQTDQNYYTNLYWGRETKKGNFSFPPAKELTAPTAAFAEGMNWGYEVTAQSSVDQRNIRFIGFSSNRLPKSSKQLAEAFASVPLADEVARTSPPPAPAPANGAARAPAHAQRNLRRLTPRP